MAEMVPDRLPSRASKGEERVFEILKRLPDDFIVYYEPIIESRYPDFIIIAPTLGVLVIEVKGWYPRDISSADNNLVLVNEEGRQVRRAHPVRQAREYMLSLMDRCKTINRRNILIQESGEHQGKFKFPFGHFAVLSNITKDQLNNLGLSEVFDSSKNLNRDELLDWCDSNLSGKELVNTLQSYFNPFWPIETMGEQMITALRACIHPEIVVSAPKVESSIVDVEEKTSEDLKVLDLRQEQNARNIRDGHRIIEGVAGSGKTILLISRVRLIAAQKPEEKLLVLCFNVSLSGFLKNVLADVPNVTVTHFDGFSKANGVTRTRQENNEDLGIRLFEALKSGSAKYSQYFDAVFIDEAQDFVPKWFSCVLEAMKDPLDGDLLIVADGNQGLYQREGVRWNTLGIKARGRKIGKKFDLDKNYRNTLEIMELANLFSSAKTSVGEDEDDIRSLETDLSQCRRSNSIKPTFIQASNIEEECLAVIKSTKSLLDGKWFGRDITPVKPNEIGILYPFAPPSNRAKMKNIIDSLTEIAPVLWLNDPNNRRREDVDFDGIRIQTINSSKGLQFKAVILMWCDQLPRDWGDIDEAQDQRLLYVGLTRPEEYLLVTASYSSRFTNRISSSSVVNLS